jgi:hypothetical protein
MCKRRQLSDAAELHSADKPTHLSEEAIRRGMKSLDKMVIRDRNRLKEGGVKEMAGCGDKSNVDTAIEKGITFLEEVEKQKTQGLTIFTGGDDGKIKVIEIPHNQSPDSSSK